MGDVVTTQPSRQAKVDRILGSVVIDRKDWENPALERRRLFAEVFGTFLLVLVACGAVVANGVVPGSVPLVARVTAPGLMVMAVILFMGAISGAHLNPAVSIAFAARGDFPWRRVPGYIVAQLVGATLACLFLFALFGNVAQLGATEPGPGVAPWQAMLIELVLTLGLVSTILGTASKAQNVGTFSALAVGGYIILAGLWAAPLSGASMNPARSFGPDLVTLDFANYWVYLVGPIIGALLAVGIAYILRGPGGDQPAIEAAQGRIETIYAEGIERAANDPRPARLLGHFHSKSPAYGALRGADRPGRLPAGLSLPWRIRPLRPAKDRERGSRAGFGVRPDPSLPRY